MPEPAAFDTGRVLVVAFEGWNDAGEAASGAVQVIREAFDLQPLASVDPEDYFDYQFNRPTVRIEDDGTRVINWPGVTAFGPADREERLHVLLGAEPSRAWKSFGAEMIEIVEDLEIEAVVFLGAMLADVPHTRPIAVFASSQNDEVRARFKLDRSNYEGPVGILSVLGDVFERSGIPTLTVWASVPHYVHNAPSPKATLALIERLEQLIEVDIPRGDLESEAAAWESGIDALAGDDDDMASYIEQLEQARDTVDSPEASGDAIAHEFEQYLRRRGDKDPGPAGDEPWRS